jgi:hypothetical protein
MRGDAININAQAAEQVMNAKSDYNRFENTINGWRYKQQLDQAKSSFN